MPLSADLRASFGEDGFDLAASFTALSGVITGIDLPALSFSAGSAPFDPASVRLDDVTSSLTSVAGGIGQVSAALPDLDAVLAPLRRSLALVDVVGAGDLPALVASLETALTPAGTGLPAVVAAASRLGEVPEVRSVLDVAGPLGLDLRAPGALVGGPAGGVLSLVQIVGALLGVETASRTIEERARLAADLLAVDRLHALVVAVGRGTGTRLAGLVAGIDPDDPRLVDLVARPIEDHLADVQELLDLLVRGLAFAEATLVDADLPALAAGLALASAALSSTALAPVHGLVAVVRAHLEPLLTLEVPSLGGTDAVWGASAALASQLETAIAALAPDALRQVVEPVVAPVLHPVRAVRRALDELGAVLATALDPVRQALDAVDLTAVRDAIHALVGPVRDAIDALAALVEGATAEVESLVASVDGLLEPVRSALTAAKDAIAAPFLAVAGVLDGLDLAGLHERIRSTLASVSDALASAPIQPVFDVATGVISTAADALGLVPRALLPDELKAALEAACAPVEALDLEPLRAELHDQLQRIIDSLDTAVLDALAAGQADVREFVASIDPRPHVEAVEREAFEGLLGGLDRLDPSLVLEPVTAALDAVRQALDGIDLAALLRPADEALAHVASTLDQVSPAQLLAPVAGLLAGVQAQVESAIALSTWDERLDDAEAAVTALAARFDPTPALAALREGWADLVATLRPRPGGTGLAAALLGGVLGGLPFPADAGGIGEVLAWTRGRRDGAAVVRGRLGGAAAALEHARAGVAALDVRALTAELDAGHRALVAAIEAYPADSVLRTRLDASLVAAAPTAALSLVLGNVEGVRATLSNAGAAVATTTAPDRSEVTLVARGLGAAFAPLSPVAGEVRSLLSAIGADPDSPDPRDALADLLLSIGPDAVLGPLEAVASSLVTRLVELVHEGVFGPLREGVNELQAVLGALTIDQLTGGLGSLHQQLVDTVNALRPTQALAEPLALFDDLRTTLHQLDPFAPVRAAIDSLRALITRFVEDFRPTAVLAPVLTAYDELSSTIDAFDVTGLVEPVLAGLRSIGGDIDRGMDEVIDALGRLQQACESDGGPIPGLDLSVAASVDLGGGFGL